MTTATIQSLATEPINLGWFRGRSVILPREPTLTERHGNCPNCQGSVQISAYRDGCERHECGKCSYLMVWAYDIQYSKVVRAEGPARVAQDGRTIFTTFTNAIGGLSKFKRRKFVGALLPPKWFPFVFTPKTFHNFVDRYKYVEGIVGHAIYGALADKTEPREKEPKLETPYGWSLSEDEFEAVLRDDLYFRILREKDANKRTRQIVVPFSPENSREYVPHRGIPVSKSDLPQAHDLNTPLPSQWDEPVTFNYFEHKGPEFGIEHALNSALKNEACPHPEWTIDDARNEWPPSTGACRHCSGPNKTAESAPQKAVRIWHTPAHWRHVENYPEHEPLPKPSTESVDAWEHFLFEDNGLNWRDCLPATYTPSVHHSLRSWVKSQARSNHDPNYSLDERMTAPHTNGILPSANTSAEVRWRPDPIAPEFDSDDHPFPSLAEDEIEANRAALSERIENSRLACASIAQKYGDAKKSTNEDPAYWERELAKETKADWLDERDKSIITWREAHAEAVATGNELWKKTLELDKEWYEPLRPRAFSELLDVRFKKPKRRHNLYTETEKYDSEHELQNEERNACTAESSGVDSAYTSHSDDEERYTFETDGISYDGVRETYSHPDLVEARRVLQIKYAPLKERIKFLTHEEQLEQARSERDFSKDALKYLVTFEGRKIADMKPEGVPIKSNTLRQQLNRASSRSEQAVKDAEAEERGEIPLFTQVVNSMTQDAVRSTVCPGGCFVIVVLNNTPELKHLGPLHMTDEEAEEQFDRVRKVSTRNAVKYARKIAQEEGIGKRVTRERIEAARTRVEQAYEQVKDIYRHAPCKAHCPKPVGAFALHAIDSK